MSNRFKGKIRGPSKRVSSPCFRLPLTSKLNSGQDVQAEYQQSWGLLSEAFKEIQRKNAGKLSFEELYRTAYNIVLKKFGEQLYRGVKEIVAEHLHHLNGTEIESAWQKLRTSELVVVSRIEWFETSQNYLKVVRDTWDDHVLCMGMISDVLMYLDRVYTKASQAPVIYDAGLNIFRDSVIRSKEFPTGRHLSEVVLHSIRIEREGDTINRPLLKNIVDMLNTLHSDSHDTGESVYMADFEEDILASTRQFYQQEAAKRTRTDSASEYLSYIERRLKEEQERTEQYLLQSSESKIRLIIEHEAIEEYMKTIIEMESGLTLMLTNDRLDDLAKMFRVFVRVDPSLKLFNEHLSTHLVILGDSINAGVASLTQPSGADDRSMEKVSPTLMALKWVQDVLDLRDKYEKILTEALRSDQNVKNTITKAFSIFINRNSKSPEFISLFIDENLKKGLKGKTEQEVDDVLDKTVSLFRYISDKDIFERYYKNHLAKRLLNNRSVSDDAERGMIAKLKVEVGSTFTSKMEGMFKDMKLSRDIMSDFKKQIDHSGTTLPVELSVSVLTSTYWPVGTIEAGNATCTFPPKIEQARVSFSAFYLNRHSGRQLNWHAAYGTADVRAAFKGKRYELNMSTYAMVIVCAFNDISEGESISFTDLMTLTSIPQSELMRTLQSLACAKFKILIKDPKGKEVKLDDRFSYNTNFSAPMTKIKIATIASKVETEGERQDTLERIEETRKHSTEACIVRTMKDRQRMDHNNLVADVTKQLSSKFVPDPAMIKRRIESLIERIVCLMQTTG